MKKILSNLYVFSILNNIMSVLIGVLTSAFLNRYLGVELRGEYAYYLNLSSILVIFIGFGLAQSYPRAVRKGLDNVKNKYFALALLQFVLSFIVLLLNMLINKNWGNIYLLIMVPSQVFAQQVGYIAAVDKLKKYQKMNFIDVFISLILNFLLFVMVPQYVIMAFIVIALKSIIDLIYYIYLLKPNLRKINFSSEELKFIFGLSFITMVMTLLININYKVDVIMLKNKVSNSQLGLYTTGTGLANYIWIIPDAFKNVLFSKTAKNDSIQDINWSIKISIAMSVICMLGLAVFGKIALFILYGIEFVSAYNVTCIIMFGAPSMILFKLISNLFIANGKQIFYCIGLSISAMVNIFLNVILIPLYGINGAAFASVISYSVCGIIFYVRYIRDYNIKWYIPLFITHTDLKKIVSMVKKYK